ncbi:WW domain-binding protein 4 isoform X2 [Tachypleus tridentatus]|uniref:WW domain-binding protein 4 isoform X2 n=1 Tax=Tachypleus tridentatus TaxID=6853 RepID=UPI003FCF03FB
MADYWKSQPRKFCEFCQCWFGDNKASIDFHEKGKKHQENVKRKLNELRKKGQKEYQEKIDLENEMKRIEEKALKAFEKDVQQNPELIKEIKNQPALMKTCEPSSDYFKNTDGCSSEMKTKVKKWFEGVSPEGYTYYWNLETNESQWEKPNEEYITLTEQQEHQANEEELLDSFGPQQKPDPYGCWEPVIKESELLDNSQDTVEPYVPVYNEENKVKFQEKVVETLASSKNNSNSEVGFKKRKNLSELKRNVRRRTDNE